MIKLYLILFGIIQSATGLMELIFPFKSYNLWKKWVFNRFFFLHGILLIAAGFPFIFYRGYLAGFLFWIGIFMTLTGPFLLIYPEKIRAVFTSADNEFKKNELRGIVFSDALIRIGAGILTLYACLHVVKP